MLPIKTWSDYSIFQVCLWQCQAILWVSEKVHLCHQESNILCTIGAISSVLQFLSYWISDRKNHHFLFFVKLMLLCCLSPGMPVNPSMPVYGAAPPMPNTTAMPSMPGNPPTWTFHQVNKWREFYLELI